MLILLAGLLIATAAFSGFYYLGTARGRALMSQPQPELTWLQTEFHLSDAELARITKLHEAYLPQCGQRCQRIAEQNKKLEQLLAQTSTVTPEIRNLLAERAATRAECEAEMLRHFLEVSRTMPPEQGRRYLELVEQQTVLSGQTMEMRHIDEPENPMAGHHHM
ncbi:MAG: periplasmic heavy metal sensor [Candidatus Dormibacteraceae bacterium]